MNNVAGECYNAGCEALDCHECQAYANRIPLKGKYDGETHMISFGVNNYLNGGGTAIQMFYWDSECGMDLPFAFLTVNLPDKPQEDCAFVDTNNLGEEIVEWLSANGIGKRTGRYAKSGHCLYPEVCFDMRKIEEYHVCAPVVDQVEPKEEGVDAISLIYELADSVLAMIEAVRTLELYHCLPHDDINHVEKLMKELKDKIDAREA